MVKGSKKNRSRAAYFNAISSVVNEVVYLLVAFVTTPLLLSWLGSSLFGVWKVCQRLLTYVSAADGRATQALKWTIANKQSVDDLEAKQRDIGCALVVWMRFLPLVLVAGGLLTWFSPHFIKNLPVDYFSVTRLACGILVGNLIIAPLRTVPEAVLIGMNMGYRCRWVHSIGAVVGGLLMVCAAYVGWGLVGLASATLVATLVRGLGIFLVAKRSLSWLQIRRPEKKEVSKFMGFSIWVFAWAFINKLMISGDIVILGLVSSARMVAYYSLTSYALQIAVTLSALLVSAAIPGLGGIVGKGEFEKAVRVRTEIITFSWILTVVSGSMILLWNSAFIRLWVGPENFLGFTENILLVIMMTQLIFIRCDAQIVDVSLNIKNKVILGGIATLIGFVLAIWLGSVFSSPVIGCVAGLILGRLILMVAYPILVRKLFNHSGDREHATFVRLFLSMVVMYAATAILGSQLEVRSWWQLIGFALVSLPILGAFAFFTGLGKPDREQVVTRVGQMGIFDSPWFRFKRRGCHGAN